MISPWPAHGDHRLSQAYYIEMIVVTRAAHVFLNLSNTKLTMTPQLQVRINKPWAIIGSTHRGGYIRG